MDGSVARDPESARDDHEAVKPVQRHRKYVTFSGCSPERERVESGEVHSRTFVVTPPKTPRAAAPPLKQNPL